VIVLDASVLIAQLDPEDAHHEAARSLLLAVADRPLGAGVLTLAEILVGPIRAERLRDAERALAELEVTPIGLGSDAAIRLARLRASTGLKLPDCSVLLAGQEVGGQVATFDERLARCAEALGLGPVV
jgi:predicted nucleic acid-binding protein